MPAVALSRVGARVVESGPDGASLAAGTWQRLEALPDPRSRRGRIYPLGCLIAVALCAFTAAGHDRFTAVGQWIRRASQVDLARLRAPWDPLAGRYRVPDEKTIRVVLDRLDPRALARALLGPGPHGHGVSETATVGFSTTQEATAATSSTGTFSASFTVPKWALPGQLPPDLARLARGHSSIEAHHHVRSPGVTFGEDTATSRTGSGPANLATIRAAITAAIKDAGYLHVPRRPSRPHHPSRNPPPPPLRLGQKRTITEHAGALTRPQHGALRAARRPWH